MTENNDYKIVTLGSSCFLKKILTEYGLKPSKADNEVSVPFDFCITPIKSLIEILNNNFIDYFKNLEYNLNTYNWFNSKYKIIYNYDTDCTDEQKEKFTERYKKRIENFRNLISSSEKFIYFVFAGNTKLAQADANLLYASLTKITCNGGGEDTISNFKLVIFDFFNSQITSSHPNCEIVSLESPYTNFAQEWWDDRIRNNEAVKIFENKVVSALKDIIEKVHKVSIYTNRSEISHKKQLFINFKDFPQPYMMSRRFTPYSNHLNDILSKYYNIVISEQPDFLFYSMFGNEYQKYENCVKIFYTEEVIAPNFNQCDYAIAFDNIDFQDRYLRYPLYFRVMEETAQDKSMISQDYAKRKFCNLIYSNDSSGEGAILRKEFCKKLSEYKKVDCPGKVLNNMPENSISPRSGNFAKGKLDFQKNYKFTIAFESNRYNGYTTEKIAQAFMANTIPIYWGDPEVTRDFNPKAFINCADYNNFDEVIEKIKELDNNDEEYLKMLREPAMREDYNFNKKQVLEDFILGIIKKGNKPFYKNPNPYINKYGYAGEIKEFSDDTYYKQFLKSEKVKYKLLKMFSFGKKRKQYKAKLNEINGTLKRYYYK